MAFRTVLEFSKLIISFLQTDLAGCYDVFNLVCLLFAPPIQLVLQLFEI